MSIRIRSVFSAIYLGAAFAATSAATLDEVVVTATRTPTPLEEVLAPTAAITREELENSLSADVTELLRFHAGVEIGRNGGIGQPTSIFIRGANSSHTLVLLDGVRINPGTFGTASLQNLPPDSIERIEIVKGPRSSLYGSDAIGGVINVITRKPQSDGFDASARAGYGSFYTRQGGATVAARSGVFSAGAHVSTIESDGFPTRQASRIDSGYDNLAVGGEAGLDFDSLRFKARAYQTEGTSDYLNSPTVPVNQDFLDRVVSAEASADLGSHWSSRVLVSRMDNVIEQNQPVSFIPGEFDFLETRRDAIDWQNDLRLGASNQLTLGAMYSDENARALSFGTFYDRDTRIKNFYAQDRHAVGAHALLLAVGYSDYSTFGAHTTWNAEYGYRVSDQVKLVAAAGTAFRAPNATDLYGFGGNPALDPESSRNAELSLRYTLDRHAFALSAFQNDIDDLIAYDNAASRVRNIAEARIRGYELSYAYRGESWRAHAEALYQNPRDRITDQWLLRRAKRSLTVGFAQTIGMVEVGVDAHYSGKRMDFGFPVNVELDDYVLVNAYARIALGAQFDLIANVENLTNTQYELARGYNTADRSGSVALRWSLR